MSIVAFLQGVVAALLATLVYWIVGFLGGPQLLAFGLALLVLALVVLGRPVLRQP